MAKWFLFIHIAFLLTIVVVQSSVAVQLRSGVINGQNVGHSVKNKATGEVIVQNNGRFAYMAAVLFNGEHKCGGVVVATNIILTAASCIAGLDKKHLIVTAGSFKRNDISDPKRQYRKVKLISIHRNYDSNGPKNDVAGLVLKKAFTFNKDVESIQLPCLDKKRTGFPKRLFGEKVTFLGWGLQNERKSENLQKTILTIINTATCQKMVNFPLKDMSMFCARDEPDYKSGHTKGDWGGPLILQSSTNDPKNDVLIGIATFPTKEIDKLPNTQKPFVYADVTNMLIGILWIIRNYEVSGWDSDWCFQLYFKLGK